MNNWPFYDSIDVFSLKQSTDKHFSEKKSKLTFKKWVILRCKYSKFTMIKIVFLRS